MTSAALAPPLETTVPPVAPTEDPALHPSVAPASRRPALYGPAVTADGRVRVLVAEDERLSREALVEALSSWGYSVTAVPEGGKAMAALVAQDAPRLALLDWEMPGLSGVDVCRMLRARPGSPYVYIVLCTSHQGQRRLIDGLAAGADDYLKKPYDLSELEVRLRAGKRVVLLQDQLLAARRELEERALTDSLTRVKNRGAIAELLTRELARTRRTRRPVSIVLGDVDHFKRVNDTYGHAGGDAVLVEWVRRVKQELRSHDDVGRWGGEEFLILTPECPSHEAQRIAERLRQAVASAPFRTGTAQLPITTSFGVAGTDQGYADLASLVSAADTALYMAKASGRNRACLADPLGAP
jgi:diguanylate cyclase (GGDEF)-like protein